MITAVGNNPQRKNFRWTRGPAPCAVTINIHLDLNAHCVDHADITHRLDSSVPADILMDTVWGYQCRIRSFMYTLRCKVIERAVAEPVRILGPQARGLLNAACRQYVTSWTL